MKKFIIIVFLFANCSFAAHIKANTSTKVNSIPEDFKRFEPLFNWALGSEKKSKNEIEPQKQKKLSRGQMFIEQMKAKNRAALEKRRRMAKQEQKSKPKSWADQVSQTYKGWGKTNKKTIKSWKEKQKQFFKNLPFYKKNLIGVPEEAKKIDKSVVTESFSAKEYLKTFQERNKTSLPKNSQNNDVQLPIIIKGAIGLPIKDQGRRPTCAAFATTYALEMLLNQEGRYRELSSQYFYWLSKPKCQTSPCNKRGSWGLLGLRNLKKSNFSVPTNQSCPYNKFPLAQNETQIPLRSSCSPGLIQNVDYGQVESLNQIVAAIRSGYPVIGGFKLTENFYKNKGMVKNEGAKFSSRNHASGHALVIMGVSQLPEKMHKKEGRICLFVMNSWGEGWGLNGKSCLTENWFKKHRFNIPFIAVKSIRI